MPTVTFGMPVYNGEKFIASTLESILGQTFTDFEVIVSDNNSTDKTLSVVRDFARRDSRIRILEQHTNIGAVANFAKVLGEARGTYFAWTSDHDLYNPWWLQEMVWVLDDHPEAVLAYSWYSGLGFDGREFYRNRSTFQTVASTARGRIAEVAQMQGGGSRIYGCFRRSAMQNVRVHVCAWWDRLFLVSMATQGAFVQVERVLWHRRHQEWTSKPDKVAAAYRTLQHQFRSVHDGGRVPWHCRLPTLWHLVCLFVDVAADPPDGRRSVRRFAVASYAMAKHLGHMREMLKVEARLAFRLAPRQMLLVTKENEGSKLPVS